jgi:hypothetical protein
VPSLEAQHIETRLGLAVVMVGQCCLCATAGGALGPCWQDGAEGPWVLKVSRRRAWFSGFSGIGFRHLSPWQRCETVEEARPPRREARISGFLRRCDESFTLKLRWVRWIADRVCAA